MRLRLVALFVLSAFFATEAKAEVVDLSNPESVAAALRALGRDAKVWFNPVDDFTGFLRTATAEGAAYQVLIDGCKKRVRCRWVSFRGGFRLPEVPAAKMDALAKQWNAGKLMGFAMVGMNQEGWDMSLVHEIEPRALDAADFTALIRAWDTTFSKFETHVGH